jgi:putative SOS response-associated peptidase YedK
MCNYMGRRVTRAEYNELVSFAKKVAFLNDELAIYKGFDHNDIPVMKLIPGTKDLETVNMQWGFLPHKMKNDEAIRRFRFGYKPEGGKWIPGYTTLNATSEELLNKMFKHAALHRRILVPLEWFYEWRHIQVVGVSGKLLKTPEKFPYKIEMRDKAEPHYFAGIYNPTFNEDTKVTTNTFAITTTDANSLMRQIHNSKNRMPTILPPRIAEMWLNPDLDENGILDISNYQVASAEMIATPLHPDFLKNPNPHECVEDARVPKLEYA